MRSSNFCLKMIILFVAFCPWFAKAETPQDSSNAVLWMQSSAEYRAITSQTIKQASDTLKTAVFDTKWTAAIEQFGQPKIEELPNAIILDLDDTLLSTTPYRAQLIKDDDMHDDKLFQKWIEHERAKLVPHIINLIERASTLGVTVLVVSDRICKAVTRDPCPAKTEALKVLSRNSLVFPKEKMFFRGEYSDWNFDQSSRRAFIAKRYRILMIVGDDLNQMIPDVSTLPESARLKLAEQYDEMWGTRWFIIPNPAYGSWRTTLPAAPNKTLMGYH